MIIRTLAAAAVASLAFLPALAQPAAPVTPDPRTTIPEKIEPPSASPSPDERTDESLSEKLDRSGGIVPPPADPGPGIEVGPPEPAPPMPVIPPPGSPGGDPTVAPK